jgi:alanyl-tRNA synthetase
MIALERTVPATEVMSGAKVFQLMDSHGLPLEIVLDRLSLNGLGFNVPGFIDAALASGNFTAETVYKLLTSRDVLPMQAPAVISRVAEYIQHKTGQRVRI